MPTDTFYITTPIYYVNDVPHIGNAYTTIACDVLARFHRLLGQDVLFATGTDEHAQKVLDVAQSLGKDARAYVDEMEPKFKQQWSALEIGFDDYIRTPEPRHVKVVQAIFQKLLEQDDIYLGSYEGWYCVSDETFFTPAEVTDERCPNPECRKPLTWVREENYFFRLSKYQDRLIEYMETHPGWLRPDYRANEVMAFAKSGLKDQSCSRINTGWGIPVPGNDSQVIYVWFDALINYLTVAGYLQDDEKFARWWPPSVQMMGKDIFVRFHCTLWPAMLMALGVELPDIFFGHGFWTIEGEKISKSKGNAIYPTELVTELAELSGCEKNVASDAVRYYLLRAVPFGTDGDFSRATLIQHFNSDLANDLGNLLNRTLSMLHKWFGGEIPPVSRKDDALAKLAEEATTQYVEALENVRFSHALEAVWSLVSAGNKYVEQSAPWALHREGKEQELADVLYNALETARIVTVLVAPFMPCASEKMWTQLGIPGSPAVQKLPESTQFGGLRSGAKAGSADPTFPRIDTKKRKPETGAAAGTSPKKKSDEAASANVISFEEFKKLDIRVARIVSAEKVQGADKLFHLSVDAGEGKLRSVVAGIAEFYDPAELAGKTVVLLANLAPAKIRGVESQGMLLAADTDGRAILLQPDAQAPPGARVR
ncbi:MAG: methionine--tRNA ligase [Armatimonadetes bacterium]|nr:methionine--tRNA ligase [Armatimonadota bacterium]